MGYEYDFVFDWMVKKPAPQQQVRNSAAGQNDEQNNEESNTPGPGAQPAQQITSMVETPGGGAAGASMAPNTQNQ